MLKRFLGGLAAGALLGAALVRACAPVRSASEPAIGPDSEPAGNLPAVRITPEMRRYSLTRYTLAFVGTAARLGVSYLLLSSGASARSARRARRATESRLGQAFVYFPLVTLLSDAILLPLTFYSGYLLPRQYGLSKQSFGAWLADEAKSSALGMLVGSPIIALLYWTIRRSPRRWWLGFWLASLPLLALSMVLGPLVIDPLFNRFEPLRNERLRDAILKLASQAGIEHGRVYQVDASRRTRELNAYVTGLFGAARIVLWDTTLEKLTEREVLFVTAHEMAHYVYGDVPFFLLLSGSGSLGLFFLADQLSRRFLHCCGDDWDVRDLADPASLPALSLIAGVLAFFGSPVVGAVSRAIERRADRFALSMTADGEAAASAFVKLSEQNLALPDPPKLVQFWLSTHPPLGERIQSALQAG